jgi:hypothetical protein
MSRNIKLPKLTDEQTKQLVEGARMACRGDAIDRFLDEVFNPKPSLPKITPKEMERFVREVEDEDRKSATSALES